MSEKMRTAEEIAKELFERWSAKRSDGTFTPLSELVLEALKSYAKQEVRRSKLERCHDCDANKQAMRDLARAEAQPLIEALECLLNSYTALRNDMGLPEMGAEKQAIEALATYKERSGA